MPVNDRFTQLIRILNFTPNSLSKELNVTQPTIKKLEKGETLPNAKVLIPLLERFNVNINWLLSGQGEIFLDGNSSSAQAMPSSAIIQHDSSISQRAKLLENENKHLKDKIALLEQSVKDKADYIELLKNQK